MMLSNIHLFKQPVPQISGNIVHRQRLTAVLYDNRIKYLIILNTPAGYGKTTLLLDYLNSYNLDYCWVQCSSFIKNYKDFIKTLIFSIRNKKNDFGQKILVILDETNNQLAVEDFYLLFIDEFSKFFNSDLIIVIDDYHNCNSVKQIIDFLNLLADNPPPFLKIILSGRGDAGIKKSRLKAKRNYIELTTNDLKFTIGETAALAQQIYGLTIPNIDIKKIVNIYEGWVTGYHFLFQYNLSFNITGFHDKSGYEEIYEYLAEDVFESLDENIREFLLKSSLLETFSESITRDVFGYENAADLIEQIVKNSLFLETFYENNNKLYRYQNMFKYFLNHKLKSLDKKYVSKLYYNIAEYYIKIKQNLHAIPFLLNSGDLDNAASVLKGGFDEFFEKGMISELLEVINKFPKKYLLSDAELFSCYTALKIYLLELSDSEIITLENFAANEKNGVILIKLKLQIAESKIINNEYDDAITLLYKIKCNEPFLELYRVYLLAKALHRKGFSYSNDALSLLINASQDTEHIKLNQNRILPDIFNLIGSLYWDRSEYDKAAIYFKKAFEKTINMFSKIKITANLLTIFSYQGENEKAFGYLEQLNSYFINYPIEYFERYYLRGKIQFCFEIGDYEESIQSINNYMLLKSVLGNKVVLHAFSIFEANAMSYTGKYIEALQKLEVMRDEFNNNDEYFTYLMEEIRLKALMKLKFKNIEAGRLLAAIDFYQKNGLLQNLYEAKFHLAKLLLYNKNYETAKSYFLNSCAELFGVNLISFLERELLDSREAFDFLIYNKINSKSAIKLIRNVINKNDFTQFSIPAANRIKLKLNNLTDIKFLPFGDTEFRLRGEPVPEDKWIRKKSKVLLAYLMSDPERIHTKDEIIDMFFDDMPADKADVAYHSTLYNIRTALKIYDIKTDKPKRSKDKTYDYNPQYILYEDKTIRLNPDFYYISANIEFEKLFSKSRLPSVSANERTEHIMKAIEIYKGDFMPGYYDSWCEELRTKYKNNYIILCEEMVKYYMAENRFDDAVIYCEKLLRNDKLNEMAYVNLIRSHVNLGAVNQAKGEYEKMLQIFKEELDEEPSEDILKQIKSILS